MESILATMTVITASSVFLLMLSTGAMQLEEVVEEDELIEVLQDGGLWSEEGGLITEELASRFAYLQLPEGVTGISLTYRYMGNGTPLISLGEYPPEGMVVLGARTPLLLLVQGRYCPGMAEVLAW